MALLNLKMHQDTTLHNCKSIPNYQELTVNNFAIYNFASGTINQESVSSVVISAYNQTTGVVSVKLTGTNDNSAPGYYAYVCCFYID